MVGVLLALGLAGGDDALDVADPAASPASEPTPEAPSPPPPPPLPPGGPTVFEGGVFQVPVGWVLRDGGDGTACISRSAEGCELQLLLPDVVTDRGGELEEIATDDDDGWSVGTDAPDCRSTQLVVSELAPIADLDAEYREWDLDCTGEPPRLRLWWLPETRFAVFDRSGDPALGPGLTEIVRTADLDDLRTG